VGPGFAEYLSTLNIGCDDIQWTDRLKYLGITVYRLPVRNVKLTSLFLCGKRDVLLIVFCLKPNMSLRLFG